MERMRFRLLVENRDPYLAALGKKKGRQSERLPNSERTAKGARIAWSLLLRRKDRQTKLSRLTLSSRLGTFLIFRQSSLRLATQIQGPPP